MAKTDNISAKDSAKHISIFCCGTCIFYLPCLPTAAMSRTRFANQGNAVEETSEV
jgi:hypothetical protein